MTKEEDRTVPKKGREHDITRDKCKCSNFMLLKAHKNNFEYWFNDLKDEVYISYEMMKDWWYILCVQAMYSKG